MLESQLEYISIYTICRNLKEKYKDLTVLEREDAFLKELSDGIIFKDEHVRIVYNEFFNPLANRQNRWYYLICNCCEKKVRKLFLLNGVLKCKICHRLHSKRNLRTITPTDKLVRIQDYLGRLLNPDDPPTPKKRKQYMQLIEKHYTELDDVYKQTFNNFLIRGLTSWCNRMLKDVKKSDDYKQAVNDVLYNLRTMKLTLIQKKLKKQKELK